MGEKRPPNDRGQGRKPRDPSGEPTMPRTIRLTESEWRKYQSLGGNDWLRERIRLAKTP